MIHIETLTLGQLQTNCYIVFADGSRSCAVIDPGADGDAVLKKVSALGLTVDAVLLTHGHFDHVGGVETIVEATDCRLWMSESDWSQFPSPLIAYYYPLANCDFTEVQFIEDDAVIQVGGLTFTALHTPGHTGGSVCLLCENALFSGDTLFFGSCGRTDLPGGNTGALRRSLERLAGLPNDYRVYPGHGGSTTLSAEKRYNPYMN